MIGDGVMRSVELKNRSTNLSGDRYLPGGFKASEQHLAIVAEICWKRSGRIYPSVPRNRDGNLFLG
jgi:hypothetical protein